MKTLGFLITLIAVGSSALIFQNCSRINSNPVQQDNSSILRMPFSCEDNGTFVQVPASFLGMGFKEANLSFDVDWVLERLSSAKVQSVIVPFNDDIIRKVANHNIKPIVVLGPPVRTDGSLSTDPYSNADLQTWEQNILNNVAIYKAQSLVNDWKFHNEPNSAQYWSLPRQYYVEMLNRFYDLVKQANPKATVWAPGVVYHTENQSPGPNNPDDWVDAVISSGRFDVFTVHVYAANPVDIKTTIRKVKEKLSVAHKNIPLALTEVSIWTSQNNCRFYGQTPEHQRMYLEKAYACAAEGGANAVYWFTATDRKAPTTGDNSQCPNGWIPNGVFAKYPSLSEKLSYDSLKRMGFIKK